MSFASPLFLLALAGIAAPVLIHLLTRDRVQHVAFSTLRFFAKGAKLVVRRKKFQELLLVLLRMAVIALLALAFARPFLGSKAVDSRHEFNTARVIVADVSASMQRPGLPEGLAKHAVAATDSLDASSDAAALITFADAPNTVVTFGSPISDVKKAAAALAPGYAGTNIADALRSASELLRGLRARHKEIVLISDLQRSGWSYYQGDWKLAQDITLTFDALKPLVAGAGVGITELSAPNSLVLDRQPSSLAVRLANYSDQPKTNLDVTLMLNGKQVDTQKINLRANGKVVARFRYTFAAAGENTGAITVAAEPDATRNPVVYFDTHVLPKIPVLLVNGNPSRDPHQDAAYFLAKALAPTDDSPFAVTTVAAANLTPGDVAAAAVVIFAGTGPIPAEAAAALPALLDRGGGAFFLPGNKASPDAFNSEFAGTAPCRLRQILEAHPSNGDTAESLTKIDFSHPIFDVFAVPHHGDLGLPKFARYWETTDTQLSQILARFGDGRPALVERHIGRGISLAFLSAIDPAWNNFADQSVFLPFVHQSVRYLAVQTGRHANYTSGEFLPVPEGDDLKDPQGKVLSLSHTSGGASGCPASQPGIYTALTKSGQQDFCYAVNPNLAEANPAVISSDEIASAIERAPDEIAGTLDLSTPATAVPESKDSQIWWYLLLGVLALSVTELVVGNKTLRH